MPEPKVTAEADGVASINSTVELNASNSSAAKVPANAGGAPPSAAMPFQPVKVAYTRPRETRGQRIAWYTLTITGSGAAAFDAYSTRRALAGNLGTESNPFLQPFAHSNALYAVTQVSPAVMDFLGKRMMVSEHRWVRRLWWVPQVAGSGFSISAGAHNMSLAQ
jgi:hypothetical protein